MNQHYPATKEDIDRLVLTTPSIHAIATISAIEEWTEIEFLATCVYVLAEERQALFDQLLETRQSSPVRLDKI